MPNDDKPPADNLELVRNQIVQICSAQLLVLKEVHEYLVPMARKFGVELDAAGEKLLGNVVLDCVGPRQQSALENANRKVRKTGAKDGAS